MCGHCCTSYEPRSHLLEDRSHTHRKTRMTGWAPGHQGLHTSQTLELQSEGGRAPHHSHPKPNTHVITGGIYLQSLDNRIGNRQKAHVIWQLNFTRTKDVEQTSTAINFTQSSWGFCRREGGFYCPCNLLSAVAP